MSESRQRLVVLSGAGISAESGLKTFRGEDGLWEGYRLEDVATPEAWERDPAQVLRFYNQRRAQVRAAQPNPAHRALARLEERFDVTIITQNIDDLHERGGSSDVLHLHGEILKAQSSADADSVVDLGSRDIEMGDLCALGSQLRPHVVWFGEPVTRILEAAQMVSEADILLVVGTSLVVYPAAGLVGDARPDTPIYAVNPEQVRIEAANVTYLREPASTGIPSLVDQLLEM